MYTCNMIITLSTLKLKQNVYIYIIKEDVPYYQCTRLWVIAHYLENISSCEVLVISYLLHIGDIVIFSTFC